MEKELKDNDNASSPDELLMKMTAQGDSTAFETLINRHKNPLLNFFRRSGANSNDEDLVQETFIRLFKYVEKYEARAKFTTFLYTIARHAWVDSLRKMQRNETLVESLRSEHTDIDDGGMNETFLRIDSQEALKQLPEKLRNVVILNIYQGLRYEEISEVLDIPLGTVKSRMFHALSKLKEIFDHDNR